MKLFSLIQLKYTQFERAVRDYLSKKLGERGASYSNSSVFGQIINVVVAAVQNLLSYVEDGIVEQNKYTAARKRSIYNLASLSGYEPSMGTTTTCLISMSFLPNNLGKTGIIIPNHTKLNCLQNGLKYNILLPQEAIVLTPNNENDNTTKYLTLVEGNFEEQSFVVNGGQLYTENIKFNGDADIDYLEVFVNEEKWERVASLYDMQPEAKQYVARTSLKSGIDLIFGDSENGKMLMNGDVIRVTYLLHSGEYGNININEPIKFEFIEPLQDIVGNEIDGNKTFLLKLQSRENVNSGTFSDSVEKVRNNIGLNSRSLVLADPKNYKIFFNRFSFVGYNRTWSEIGSLVINSLVLKNYKANINNGKDYFKLSEDDFKLSKVQKDSLINNIMKSGQQLAGAVVNIFDPVIAKYALYIYVKLKNDSYDTTYVSDQIKTLVGEFFTNLSSDIFIPKSDIVKLLKDNIEAIDGVNLYFLSERNETALIERHYTNKVYKYNPALQTYNIETEEIYLYPEENPNLGLDSHGNIYLDDAEQYPVLMGGWKFISSQRGEELQYATVEPNNPITIIYE